MRLLRFALLAVLAPACVGNLADSLEADGPDAHVLDAHAKLGAAHGVEGELVEYEMKVAGIPVGRMQIAVGRRGVVNGRPAVIVHSRASLAGAGTLLGNLDWELTTTVDIDSGFAIDEIQEITADTVSTRDHDKQTRHWTIDEHHHNPHSAAGALRGWFTAPGAQDVASVSVFDASIPVTIADAAHGDIVRNLPTVRYEGTLRDRYAFSVWVSDDTARVPLKLHSDTKVGPVDIELVSYEVPRDL